VFGSPRKGWGGGKKVAAVEKGGVQLVECGAKCVPNGKKRSGTENVSEGLVQLEKNLGEGGNSLGVGGGSEEIGEAKLGDKLCRKKKKKLGITNGKL